MHNFKQDDVFAGRYLLQKHLGDGGFAEVWKAWDKVSLTVVAIKIFRPQSEIGEEGESAFQREFGIVQELNHTHLLRPQHFDIYQTTPYLILPFCEKGSLRDQINRAVHPFTEEEIAIFMAEAAGALAYLHEQKILHQDIKPGNILIHSRSGYLLSDFGISQKIRSTLSMRQTLKLSEGNIYGPKEKFFTPDYAAPELLDEAAKPDFASDVFALGVILYEMTRLNPPFYLQKGESTGGLIEAGNAISPIPSEYSVELNEIIMACLAKDPFMRPKANQLAQLGAWYLEDGEWSIDTGEQKKSRGFTTRRITKKVQLTVKQGQTHISDHFSKWKKAYLIGLSMMLFLALGYGIIQGIGEPKPVKPKTEQPIPTTPEIDSTRLHIEDLLTNLIEEDVVDDRIDALEELENLLAPDHQIYWEERERNNSETLHAGHGTVQSKLTPFAISASVNNEVDRIELRDYNKNSNDQVDSLYLHIIMVNI